MKAMTVFIIVLFLFTGCINKNACEMKVMSLNIRVDVPSDGINAWTGRAALVSSFISRQQPDLFGLQEAMWHQYKYLDSVMVGYGSVLEGGPGGFSKGYASPLFYRLDRFTRLASGTFWLSTTPDVPGSVGWGAAFPRSATWIKLLDKECNDTIVFFNTHLDHVSDSARYFGAEMLVKMTKALSGNNNYIITGDFNAMPESIAIMKMKEDGFALDAYEAATRHLERSQDTFNGWEKNGGKGRIDYIFISKEISVSSFNISEIVEESVFISDHWPVTAVISCK